MNIKCCIGISVILLCFACSSKQNGLVYFNNFDNIKGWEPALLKREPRASGQFSNKLDSTSKYSLTFKLPFIKLSEWKIKKVKVGLSVFMTDTSSESNLVVEVNTVDKNKKLYVAKSLKDYVRGSKQWTKVDCEFTLVNDDIALPENIISIYCNNLSKQDIFIDNFRIEFVI
jgi:hypothetical protein